MLITGVEIMGEVPWSSTHRHAETRWQESFGYSPASGSGLLPLERDSAPTRRAAILQILSRASTGRFSSHGGLQMLRVLMPRFYVLA